VVVPLIVVAVMVLKEVLAVVRVVVWPVDVVGKVVCAEAVVNVVVPEV
jgi:hypothetical protein